jgi:hypothetical protein
MARLVRLLLVVAALAASGGAPAERGAYAQVACAQLAAARHEESAAPPRTRRATHPKIPVLRLTAAGSHVPVRLLYMEHHALLL